MIRHEQWVVKGDNEAFRLAFDGGSHLEISGKLSAMPEEYELIEIFFQDVLDEVVKTDPLDLVLDITGLLFLNSSGIKSLCVSLVMEADDREGLHLTIFGNRSITWQIETLPTFKDLMDNLEIRFSGKE